MKDNTVYISFGSNKGDSLANIKAAIALLEDLGHVKAVSPLFKTKPEGFLEQEDFINGALCLSTLLRPQELLEGLKKIESAVGRKPSFKNAPREIDLDIIFYNSEVINTPALQVPHPLCHKREFVLRPLSFIAADFIHPLAKQSVKTILDHIMMGQASTCQKLTDSLL